MNNFVLDRIKGKNLTKGQEKIATYMIHNPYSVCQKSLMEVSKEIGVSDVSVLRFVRLIGFDGYGDFKAALYARFTEQISNGISSETLALNKRLDANANLRDEHMFRHFIEITVKNVEESLIQNDADTYETVIEHIQKSSRVFIFGNRATKTAAEQFSRSLAYIRDSIIPIHETYDVYPVLQGIGENDLFIFLCTSRFYENDVKLCRAVRDKSAKLCLITNIVPSPITKYADYILIAQAKSISYFNSMVGVFSICEYLAALLCKKDEVSAQKRLDSINVYRDEKMVE